MENVQDKEKMDTSEAVQQTGQDNDQHLQPLDNPVSFTSVVAVSNHQYYNLLLLTIFTVWCIYFNSQSVRTVLCSLIPTGLIQKYYRTTVHFCTVQYSTVL